MKRHSMYWNWKWTQWLKPFYFIPNWFHLVTHAREIATALDNCMRALGNMNHVDYRCPNKDCENCKKVRVTDDRMTMPLAKRQELMVEAYKVLPPRKFR